ncbi:GAF domain-containing protein [Cellulosimicrobium cellulans]|uniref:GAF domain-containing protein n=1 Tax=Cellulosimicrobium cellulans TaxID=1710 RepID=UPI00365ADB5E
MASVDNPILATRSWIGAEVDRRAWISPVSAGVGSIGAGALLAAPNWWRILLALVVVLVFVVPEACAAWWRREEERTNGNALARQHLLFRDALKPLAGLTAELLSQDGADRAGTVGRALQQAVGSCILPFENDAQVRALVFAVTDDGLGLECVARTGREQSSEGFASGTTRANKALKTLKAKKPVHVRDLGKTRPREWAGSGDGYACFITVPIYDSSAGYGLLSIDAPKANTFSDSDVVFVELVASMLAVVLADRSRTSTTGSSSDEGA